METREHERVATPIGDGDSAERRRSTERSRPFGEKLLDQTTASRTERQAHCHFMTTQERSSEEEITHVRASDEKNEKNDPGCDAECRRNLPTALNGVFQSGRIQSSWPRFVSGKSFSSRFAIALSSACACCRVTPGFKNA